MQNEKCKRVDSGGFVIEHVQVKMVDLTTGEALGPNQSGELYCKSPTMMLGYYKNSQATKETIDDEGKTFFIMPTIFLTFCIILLLLKYKIYV